MKKIVYGVSIRGNDHYISGQGCQDANSYCVSEGVDDNIAVVAISDGHGGAPYSRSAYGSAFAVDVAEKEMKEFLLQHQRLLDELDSIDKQHRGDSIEAILKAGVKNEFQLIKNDILVKLDADFALLKDKIWSEWKKRVDADLTENPITLINASMSTIDSMSPAEEKSLIGYGLVEGDCVTFINTDIKEAGATAVRKNPRQLYGATLICVGNYKHHYFVVQIGDGNIVVIDKNDLLLNLFEDDGLLANETYSLCQANALSHFKERYFCADAKIVMLSTDGIVNAVEDESYLVNLAKGIYENVIVEPQGIKRDFKQLLRNFSNGSGDDCTISFIANNVPDDNYKSFVDSLEIEEVNDLEKLYRPKLEPYKFQLTEVEAVPKVNDIYKFNEISKKIFSTCLLLDDYKELIAKKESVSDNPKGFLEKRLAKKLLEIEQELNEEQTRIYNEKLNLHLKNNPLIIVAIEQFNIGLKDGGLDIYEKPRMFGIVKEIEDRKVKLEIIDEIQYNKMHDAGYQMFYLDAILKLDDTYAISIKKDKISLINTKE